MSPRSFDRRDKCFVIVPFDKKTVPSKSAKLAKGVQIDFEAYCEELLFPAIELAGFEPKRVKDIGGQRVIHQNMFDLIRTCPMVVADLTYYNPNVLYEVGVRHALARNGTVLLRLVDSDRFSYDAKTADSATRSQALVPWSDIPFDINSLTIHSVSPKSSDPSLDHWKRHIADAIVACRDQTEADSPVFVLLEGMKHQIGATKADASYDLLYETTKVPGTFLGIRAGDIKDLTRNPATPSEPDRTVDIWCNSENTRLEMARMNDRSVSSVIRHLGSKSLDPNHADFDSVQAELTSAAVSAKKGAPVEIGDVFQTSSGRLLIEHQHVLTLLHVVSVVGHPGQGYRPPSDEQLRLCMGNVLKHARAICHQEPVSGKTAYSLLVPLFSSGQAGQTPDRVAKALVNEAVSRVEKWDPAKLNADLTKIFFSAYSIADADAVRRAFEQEVKAGRLKPVDDPGGAPPVTA